MSNATAVSAKAPCFRRLVTGKGILSGEMAGERSACDTKIANSQVLEISTNNTWSIVDKIELKKRKESMVRSCREIIHSENGKLFFKNLRNFARVRTLTSFSVFKFEPIDNRPLRISYLVRQRRERFFVQYSQV